MTKPVLILNPGSSTLKASVLDGGETMAAVTVPMRGPADAAGALRAALGALAREGADAGRAGAAGYRVVHGGAEFTKATLVDDAVLERIAALAWLAPLHNPVAVEVIRAARVALPRIPHIAAFDTAFHATLAPEAYVYALPHEWESTWGYRRFGFHGLSVAWSVERAASLLDRSAGDFGLVVAHLGAGCSVTSVWQGRSAGTSMGMTPLEGLVMATRAGSVDPGILIAAQRDHGLDTAALEDVLEHRSGLLGLSGTTADMRELLAAAAADPRAALAIAVFARSAAAAIGAAATALPRLDAIVFTGGIGEHAHTVRADIVARLVAIGVPPVKPVETTEDGVLARATIAVLRIEAREDRVIARQVRDLVPV